MQALKFNIEQVFSKSVSLRKNHKLGCMLQDLRAKLPSMQLPKTNKFKQILATRKRNKHQVQFPASS